MKILLLDNRRQMRFSPLCPELFSTEDGDAFLCGITKNGKSWAVSK